MTRLCEHTASPMTGEAGEWVWRHVLAPCGVYPQQPHCPCQITASACERGEHDECGHDYWVRYEQPEPEGRLLSTVGMPVVDESSPFAAGIDVWLADRACRTYCNCPCHQPPPEPATNGSLGAGDQLDLFTRGAAP